jgi:hypothetical protein
MAYQERAQALESLAQTEPAVTAWRTASQIWKQIGNRPGQLEALAHAGMLLIVKRPTEAKSLLEQAMELARKETKHPVAAADALNRVSHVFLSRSVTVQADSVQG